MTASQTLTSKILEIGYQKQRLFGKRLSKVELYPYTLH